MPKSFIRSSSIVAAMTFLSRILGLVRDFVIARYFGANGLTDAFLVAFRIPNFFRRLFAGPRIIPTREFLIQSTNCITSLLSDSDDSSSFKA